AVIPQDLAQHLVGIYVQAAEKGTLRRDDADLAQAIGVDHRRPEDDTAVLLELTIQRSPAGRDQFEHAGRQWWPGPALYQSRQDVGLDEQQRGPELAEQSCHPLGLTDGALVEDIQQSAAAGAAGVGPHTGTEFLVVLEPDRQDRAFCQSVQRAARNVRDT